MLGLSNYIHITPFTALTLSISISCTMRNTVLITIQLPTVPEMSMGDSERERGRDGEEEESGSGVCGCSRVNVFVFRRVFCFLQQGMKSVTVTSSSAHTVIRGPSVQNSIFLLSPGSADKISSSARAPLMSVFYVATVRL